MKKIIYLSLVALVLTSCSSISSVTTSNEVSKPAPVAAPEGMEFETYNDYKEFASVNVPISGNNFKAEDHGRVLPSVLYRSSAHIAIWPNIGDTEGDFAAQLEAVKRKLGIQIKENTTVVFEEKKLGDKNVALVDIETLARTGAVKMKYGYLVQHGNKAALVMAYDAYFTPSQIEQCKSELDETFQYIVKTMQFN